MSPKYDQEIDAAAKKYGLEKDLIFAVIQIESSGNTWANRYEPKWKYFLNPKYWAKKLRITEKTAVINEATSWGLMQVMGSVARELGFNENLPKLCCPKTGIDYGCMKLRQCINSYGSIQRGLAAYNTGRPSSKKGRRYAMKVLKVRESLRLDQNGI